MAKDMKENMIFYQPSSVLNGKGSKFYKIKTISGSGFEHALHCHCQSVMKISRLLFEFEMCMLPFKIHIRLLQIFVWPETNTKTPYPVYLIKYWWWMYRKGDGLNSNTTVTVTPFKFKTVIRKSVFIWFTTFTGL